MPVAEREATRESGSLLDELEASLKGGEQRHRAPGLLRALSRGLLPVLETRRVEPIAAVEKRLRFLARRLRRRAESGQEQEAGYLAGRVDALLDLCEVAMDRSLSEPVLRVAQRNRVADILAHLIEHESRPTELARALQLGDTHVLNLLRAMEAVGLVRRRRVGRACWVTVGPQAEAALTEARRSAGDRTG